MIVSSTAGPTVTRILGVAILVPTALWLSPAVAAPRDVSTTAKAAPKSRADISSHLAAAAAARSRGDYDEAIKHYLQALAKQEAAADRVAISATLNRLALVYDAAGRQSEADDAWKRGLSIRDALALEDELTATIARNLALLYNVQKRFKDAEPLFARALAIRRRVLAPDHPDLAESLINLAALYRTVGRPLEAMPLFSDAAAVFEKRGAEAELATTLNRLGLAADDANRPVDAEAAWKRSLAIREKILPPDDPAIATVARNLGIALQDEARLDEAEPLLARALAIRRQTQPPDQGDIGESLDNLAQVYRLRGRFADAAALCEESIAIFETAIGRDSARTATERANLAVIYTWQGRYPDAERLLRQALEAREKTLGPGHDLVGRTLMLLGDLSRLQNKEEQGEAFYRRAIPIRERAAPDSQGLAELISSFASMLRNQYKYEEADRLFRRALAIQEKAVGVDQVPLASTLSALAASLTSQNKKAEAEPLVLRSLNIRERIYGRDSQAVASTLVELARFYQGTDRLEEAEAAAKRAVAIGERQENPDRQFLSFELQVLGGIFERTGRYAEAEPLYRRVLDLVRQVLGPDGLRVASAWDDLADICTKQKKLEEALTARREALRIRTLRAERDGEQSRNSVEGGYARTALFAMMRLLVPLAQDSAAIDEAFQAAQRAGGVETARSLANMTARFSSGSDELAALVRQRQDRQDRLRMLDESYVKAMSQSAGAAVVDGFRKEIGDLESALKTDDALLETRFPRFAQLSRPQVSAVADVQAALRDEEALILWSIKAEGGTNDAFCFVIRKTRSAFFRMPMKPSDIAAHVAALRNGLDRRGRDLIDMPAFDAAKAHALYRAIIGPGEDLLDGAKSLIVVPDGALQSIPPGILLTDPTLQVADDHPDYRTASWLGKKYAITILPAVSSLAALRALPRTRSGARPYAGFGDPDFSGPDTTRRVASLSPESLFRSGAANIDNIRALPPLPETAAELRAEANILGADAASVHLGQAATVTTVKSLDLQDVRVLAFATHGLVAGELPDLAEPALVLTPPAVASPGDDGLLRASDVAHLKLNAEWVVLSACNTASPSGLPGAEGLSGLAKSFFYAGARTLLVSHWPVDSNAAIRLTTGAFEALSKDPDIGRAEAFRQSMVTLMNGANSNYAHPIFWAPFVVVGDGGAGR